MSLEEMRVSFRRLAAVQVALGAWTDLDAAEIGAAIRAAVASGDATQVEAWADYLAAEAAAMAPLAQACREAQARIRAAVDREREEAIRAGSRRARAKA